MNEVCVPAAPGAKGSCDQGFNTRVHAGGLMEGHQDSLLSGRDTQSALIHHLANTVSKGMLGVVLCRFNQRVSCVGSIRGCLAYVQSEGVLRTFNQRVSCIRSIRRCPAYVQSEGVLRTFNQRVPCIRSIRGRPVYVQSEGVLRTFNQRGSCICSIRGCPAYVQSEDVLRMFNQNMHHKTLLK